MAFLNGIFGTSNKPQSQAPQQPQQQNQPQPGVAGNQQNSSYSGNGNSGGNNGNQNPGQNGNGQGGESNPLDSFMQLMTPKADPNAQKPQQQEGLFGGMTREAIQTHAKSANFAEGLNPEVVQKALGGDVQAFMDAINTVTQNAFAASVQASQGLVEHGVKTGTDRFSSGLDSRFKDYELRNKNSSNKALQHPMGKAFMKMVGSQIATANPQMSAEEIHSKSEEMFLQFAQQINAKPEGQQDPNAKPEQDWLKYLEDPQA